MFYDWRLENRGFTLVELVLVIVIMGVLAAVALPRFLNLGTDARLAALKSLQGVLQTTAINVHVLCMADTACANAQSQGAFSGALGGLPVTLYMGWFDAGEAINAGEIDSWINYSGFTVESLEPYQRFHLDSAHDT